MLIVGCDYHPRWQQVAWFDTETGETGEQKLVNGDGEAERWYRQLPVPSLIGLEATGNSQWFIDLLEQLGHEVWIGDAAQIRASYVRKQKNDRRDAGHILKLLREGRFPRLWVPSAEQRDLRQLLIHRHKLVQIRARVKNGLQHLAHEPGDAEEARLWSEAGQKALRELPLAGWAECRRRGPAGAAGDLDQQIGRWIGRRNKRPKQHPQARLLLTQPGVGPITALAFVLTIGDVSRFRARQAGGQLSGADSARAQLGRAAAAGSDQQTGQRFSAHAAGGSGAECGSAG